MTTPHTNHVVTFGCRLNSYETEVIKQKLTEAAAENTIVVNTCAVTNEAERQAQQTIRRLRREHPDKKIIVTGCAAQIDPAKYASMTEVDRVLGNQEKLQLASYQAHTDTPTVHVTDIMQLKENAGHLIQGYEGKARAFIEIQNGCNHRCTFCTIPFGRGNNRSVPMGEIVEQVRQLVQAGYAEIVLTGVDITDYGSDLPGNPTLGQMIRRMLQLVPELPWLRLSSIDVAEIDSDLRQLLATEPRLVPHLHLSVQAGDNMILKRMKRRHSREDVLAFCAWMRTVRPDVAFGADIIAGFPTETEEMFENSYQLMAEIGFAYLHVFPYSARKGTPAARMPQVPVPLRKERAARLRALGETHLAAFLQLQLGKELPVLIESPGKGRTAHYAPVQCPEHLLPGTIQTLKIVSADGKQLFAKLA